VLSGDDGHGRSPAASSVSISPLAVLKSRPPVLLDSEQFKIQNSKFKKCVETSSFSIFKY
jgi:hypothetical protein